MEQSNSTHPGEGLGTAGSREAQKAEVAGGADTLAPGVPAPQPGGPEQPSGAGQSVGVGGTQPPSTTQQRTSAASTMNTDAVQVEEGLPVISGTHQMGVQSGIQSPFSVNNAPYGAPINQAAPTPQPGSDPKAKAAQQQAESDANPASRSSQPNPGRQ